MCAAEPQGCDFRRVPREALASSPCPPARDTRKRSRARRRALFEAVDEGDVHGVVGAFVDALAEAGVEPDLVGQLAVVGHEHFGVTVLLERADRLDADRVPLRQVAPNTGRVTPL